MILSINLLPEQYRPAPAGSIEQFPQSPLARMLVIGLAGLAVGLAGWHGTNRVRLHSAKAKLHAMAPKKERVDQLRSAIATLQRQAQALEEADHQRSNWTPRLNAIADMTPPGMWFMNMTMDTDKLVLNGVSIRRQGEEMAAVNRLVQQLKQDPRLGPVIQNMQLGELRNKQDGDVELMDFTITCHFVPTERPAPAKKARRK